MYFSLEHHLRGINMRHIDLLCVRMPCSIFSCLDHIAATVLPNYVIAYGLTRGEIINYLIFHNILVISYQGTVSGVGMSV